MTTAKKRAAREARVTERIALKHGDATQFASLFHDENNLTAERGHESLYGGRVRLFTAKSLQAMLLESSLAVIAERGVRVISDYLPPSVSSGFWRWSANWASDRSLPPSPATRIAWHIALVK
jgi:hypothetical protein